MRWRAGCCWLGVVLGWWVAVTDPAAARSDVVRAGAARFEVLTPTLIRLEYAQDGRFENRRTMTTAGEGRPRVPRYEASRARGWLTIRTAAATLCYRLGSGPFTAANLRLELGSPRRFAHPTAANGPGTLGGWRRALDLQSGPVPLHDGLLSRAGWYVLDDPATVL